MSEQVGTPMQSNPDAHLGCEGMAAWPPCMAAAMSRKVSMEKGPIPSGKYRGGSLCVNRLYGGSLLGGLLCGGLN
eukprot:1905117-Alexandrium_andersonii.AAC.1